MNTTTIRAAAGVLLLLWGLQAGPVRAISISPDAAEGAMNLVSYSADCTGDNLSANRAVCRDTLAGLAREEGAWEVAEEVADSSLGRIGKLGKGALGAASRKVLRAVGPAGKLEDAWSFGTTVGTAVSDRVVSPRMEAHYQEQERREREKIKAQTDLLRSDRYVAGEYRAILMERGEKDANAYLDEQTRAAQELAEDPAYSYHEEMERMERTRRQAEMMDEDAARRRNREREAQAQANENRDSESASMTSDTGTGEADDRQTWLEDDTWDYPDRQNQDFQEQPADPADSYYEEMERTERAGRQTDFMEDNREDWGDDYELYESESDPDLNASCDSSDIYPVDDPCAGVRADFERWADNITSPEYLETISCQKILGDMHDHIDAFEACYHREYANMPVLYRCSVEFLDTWRQMITDVTRGSGCAP